MSGRLALLAAASLVVVVACGSSGDTQSIAGLAGANGTSLSASDTSKSPGHPTNPGSGTPHDSATKPADSGSVRPSTPVATYTLTLNVAETRGQGADTTNVSPVAGAAVTVSELTYQRTTSASDSLTAVETLVASGVSSTDGRVTFPGLKGTSLYIVHATPPAGSPDASGSLQLNQMYSSSIYLTVLLRHP